MPADLAESTLTFTVHRHELHEIFVVHREIDVWPLRLQPEEVGDARLGHAR
jgi:hypothetical protein